MIIMQLELANVLPQRTASPSSPQTNHSGH
jgi:hypothetical protein